MKKIISLLVYSGLMFWFGWSIKVVSLGFSPNYLFSFVTTVATVALVWVTWKYVVLTGELANIAKKQMEASEKQLNHIVAQAKMARREQLRGLDALCSGLIAGIDEISQAIGREQYRELTIPWDDRSLQNLDLFAPILGAEEARLASRIRSSLYWIGKKAEEMRACSVVHSVKYLFQGGQGRLDESRRDLEKILEQCRRELPAIEQFTVI